MKMLTITWKCPECGDAFILCNTLYSERFDTAMLRDEMQMAIGDHMANHHPWEEKVEETNE